MLKITDVMVALKCVQNSRFYLKNNFIFVINGYLTVFIAHFAELHAYVNILNVMCNLLIFVFQFFLI